MLRSMTGFGRSEKHENSVSYKVEARSVNSRFIEINTRIPKTLAILEQPVKKLVKIYCSRGSFDITITLERNNGSAVDQDVKPNIPLVSQYVDALNQIKNQFKLSGEVDINSIVSLRDVIKYEPIEVSSPANEAILTTVEEALTALIRMRDEEGKNLQEDIIDRINTMEKLSQAIKARQPAILHEYQERLKEKIRLLNQGLDADPARLAQETAIMADRCDVTEEIIRLGSHFQQFKSLMEEKESQGRKLEFITQEINRETNTIGSKTNDSQVSQWVIEMKCTLEKIREQLQNIE